MKISNSKKRLAKIISENGGWRDGAEWAAQDKDGEVFGFCQKPKMGPSREVWGGEGCTGPLATRVNAVRNWHQTVLSRDEYFHLYPAPDAYAGSLSVTLDLVTDENKHEHVDSKPTIEQLAADHRNAKDYADRKQQEADAAKADADAKLAGLVAAGKAIGLVLSVADAPEPELVITDWRDLRVGDEIRCTEGTWASCFIGRIGVVVEVEDPSYTGCIPLMVEVDGESDWGDNFDFIRRPAKGDANA